MAPALLQAGVGSVVAVSHPVHVETAKLVCERLYQELVAGRNIGAALDAARRALHANPRRWLSTEPDPETIPLQASPRPHRRQRSHRTCCESGTAGYRQTRDAGGGAGDGKSKLRLTQV